MSFVKRFISRHLGDKGKSTNSTRSVAQLLESDVFEGRGSFFDDGFSTSTLGINNNVVTSSGDETTSADPKNKVTPTSVPSISEQPLPNLRVSSASPRRTSSPATHATYRSMEETSIEVLEEKIRKLSGALGLTTMVSGRSSGDGYRQEDQMDIELRHLEARTRRIVIQELDSNRGWQALAAEITHPDKPEDANNKANRLFDEKHIQLLSGDNKTTVSPTDEILKTWSTTGRNRPTIRDLYNMLRRIEQHNVASQLAEGLRIRENEICQTSLSSVLTDDMHIPSAKLEPYLDGMYQICFESMAQATNNFSINSANKIGEGNFGSVYRVMIDGQEMAVKKFKNPAEGELFFREIRTLAKLNHPNLLSLYGVVDTGTKRCIITRYMKNGNLERKLRNEVLPWVLRLRILRDVASALEHMHSLKPAIIHRDVKPANILLDDDMNALLGDFGLSREKKGSHTSFTHTCPGTPHYMALDILRGDVTVKSDMYSFGVIVLEILTGLTVFDPMRKHTHITDYVDDEDAQQVVDNRLPFPPTLVIEGLFNLGIRCKDNNKNIRPDSSAAKESLQQYYTHVAGLDLDNA